MRFDDYQKKSRETARYPKIGHSFIYPVIGLAGETGELLNKIKKIFRDGKGRVTSDDKDMVAHELGDILWYMAQVATEFDVPLGAIAKKNLERLKSRAERGVIGGNGDKR